MNTITTKTILTSVKPYDGWFSYDYNMNLYRGCCHGCIYCDSRSDCYRVNDFDTVRVKENAISILEKELISKRKKGIVGVGSMSDTYNPFERKLEVTRSALKLIDKYGYGVCITTKSDLILRDIDILKSINEKNPVIVNITITNSDDDMSSIIEPNVCVSSKRFEAIKRISNEGILVGVLMNPILPFINDTEDNIKNMVRLSYESGAKFIYTYMGVTLRDNQRLYYYNKLDQYFPMVKEKYIKNYGNSYNCISKKANNLYKIFIEECNKYGIVYKMKDIVNLYINKEKSEQISLF